MNQNIKAGTWYLIGNLFDKAIAFLTIPIFTRLLTTSEYGVVSTYISWVTILSIVLGICMDSSLQTAYMDFKEDIESYCSSICTAGLLFSAIFTIVVLFGSFLINVSVSPWLIFLALLQGVMTYVLNVAKMYFMMQVKYVQRVIIMSVPHTLIAILSVWGIMLCESDKYWGRIIPYALVMTAFAVAMLIFFAGKAKKRFVKKYVKYALSYSGPLVFHSLSLQILSQSDQIMITSLRSTSETGVYSLIYNVGLIAQVFTNALDNAWLPWYQKKISQRQTESIINSNASRLLMIVAMISSGIVLVAPEIIKLLSSEEYWSGTSMVVPIMLSTYFMFMYTLEVHTEYVYKRTKQIPLYTMIAAAINLILNFVFIPIYGATAAAYTTLVSYLLSFVLHYIAAHKCNKDLLSFGIFFVPTCIVVAFSVVMSVFIDVWSVRWGIGILLGIIFVVYIFKNKIFSTLMKD